MKLYNIPDAREFFSRVQGCSGRVFVVEKDGNMQDLKALAQSFICSEMVDNISGIPEIRIVAEKPSDSIALLNYVAGMHFDKKSA